MNTTYIATIDVLDGMHKTSYSIKESTDIIYTDEEILQYFDHTGKSKYGDKYVKVSTIERVTDHQQNVVIYNNHQGK